MNLSTLTAISPIDGRYRGKTESLDSALRRFKRSCQKSGVLAECRKREHYEKPSVKRKKKSEAARKNNKRRSF